jgi:hypothetical protein
MSIFSKSRQQAHQPVRTVLPRATMPRAVAPEERTLIEHWPVGYVAAQVEPHVCMAPAMRAMAAEADRLRAVLLNLCTSAPRDFAGQRAALADLQGAVTLLNMAEAAHRPKMRVEVSGHVDTNAISALLARAGAPLPPDDTADYAGPGKPVPQEVMDRLDEALDVHGLGGAAATGP